MIIHPKPKTARIGPKRLLLQLPVELERIVQRLRGAAGIAARQLDLGGVKTYVGWCSPYLAKLFCQYGVYIYIYSEYIYIYSEYIYIVNIYIYSEYIYI